MTRSWILGLSLLLLSSGISILWGVSIERTKPDSMLDFDVVYDGARCLMQGCDPYVQSEFLRAHENEKREYASGSSGSPLFPYVAIVIYPPTVFFCIAPVAMLPWGIAHVLWMTLTASILTLASVLIWSLAAKRAIVVTTFLVCIVLANSEIVIAGGNPSGIVVSLCVIATWCFLMDRWAPAGILCLAAALAIKPHDAGLIWLYFLLAGGLYRKRALQTLALAAGVSVLAVLWVSHVAPHWVQELHSNIAIDSVHGSIADPGVVPPDGPHTIIDLQSALSVLQNEPGFYNPVTYLVIGPLLLAWMLVTIRARPSSTQAFLALAAVVPLSILPVYHRLYDAKLLLLTVPACAILFAEGGILGWLALLLDTVGFVFTGDIPAQVLVMLTGKLKLSTASSTGKLLTMILTRPYPLILLITGVFYLAVYAFRSRLRRNDMQIDASEPALA